MKAVYIASFGGAENLELREVPEPARPQNTEVLVRVRAAGVNRADLLQRRGLYPPPSGYSPYIPGLEFAGVVEEAGDGVAGWQTGDRVFGITAGEAQAELLKVDASLIAAIPNSLTFTQAAAIPEAFMTAYDAVVLQGGLKAGEVIAVHSAGSGVGLAAVQLAKSIGARTVGTSRTVEKLEKCREFGLDDAELIAGPSDVDRFAKERSKSIDLVLDLVGADLFNANLKVLADKGRLLLVGLTSGRHANFDLSIALQKRLRIIGTVLRSRSLDEKAQVVQAFKDEVLPLFERQELRPNLDRTFEAADVRRAHEYMESNKNFGKLILVF